MICTASSSIVQGLAGFYAQATSNNYGSFQLKVGGSDLSTAAPVRRLREQFMQPGNALPNNIVRFKDGAPSRPSQLR